MKRTASACAAALIGAAALATTASAAVLPGTYKGKAGGAATTVAVVGNKVTIKVAKFPIKCMAPTGKFTQPSPPTRYEFKGTIKGGKVSGNYAPPLGGNGEYVTAKGTFTRATKSFAGTLSVVQQMCRGTAAVKAKKA